MNTKPAAPRVVIVGAGPAGIRAAQMLLVMGIVPTLLDEAAIGGGQIYRQPPGELLRPYKALYGFEARKAQDLHAALGEIRDRIDYRPDTLVWDVRGDTLFTVSDGQTDEIVFDRLIIATGAMDRVLPVRGWLTPGAYTLGASQVAMKYQACAVGESVVFMGCGPLLYLVAYQYAKAGVKVAAVLDTSSALGQWRAIPRLLAEPALLCKGLFYVAWLRLQGVPIHHDVLPIAIEGGTQVQAVVWEKKGVRRRTVATAVAFGYGLRSETQLADLADCAFHFDDMSRQWLPERTLAGRSSRSDVYLAGDGAGIGGADAAELAGKRAALAVAEDLGLDVDSRLALRIERRLRRMQVARRGLELAFPFPVQLLADLPDDVTLCRCEEVTLQAYREQVVRLGARELNRAKAFTRVGMGRCQGRVCGLAAAEVLASTWQQPIAQSGRLRGQAPVKPLFVDVKRMHPLKTASSPSAPSNRSDS